MLKMLVRILLAAVILHVSYGLPQTVTVVPYNIAQELGRNVTIPCVVENRIEHVQWKFRKNGTTTFNAITFNQNVLGTKTKYALTGEFNLTLMALTWDDEGTYRCIVGLKEYDMNLTVVDLPSSVAISWAGANTVGSMVNLTCEAANGRPPAPLKWLIDGVDHTNRAINETTIDTNGYGNSTSYLPLYLDDRLRDKTAQCFVSYDGWDRAMNDTYVIQHNGANSKELSALLIPTILMLLTTVTKM